MNKKIKEIWYYLKSKYYERLSLKHTIKSCRYRDCWVIADRTYKEIKGVKK